MKVISFNINGLRARLHQLQAIIDKHQPDVIGLQEIKVHDDAFPLEAVEAMGYHVYFHGQKAHYGVAMLCKKEPVSVQKGFPTDTEEHQKRMIMVTVEDDNGEKVTVLNGYFP
jgi:exodeoxyribonuclease-3